MGTTRKVASRQLSVASSYEPIRPRSLFGDRPHRRRGLWVVLLGPDGAGKSSVIEEIGDGVAAGFNGCVAYHLRPALTGKKRVAPRNCNPHGQKARCVLVTLGKLVYLLAANWLGYLAKVRPRVQGGALVMFDRYFPDGLVDPRRYRLPRSSRWMVTLIDKLVPKPDLYVVLEAPVTVLRERKTEVTFLEAERLCRAYHQLADKLPNAVTVDASRPLSHVVDEVLECSIVRHLARHGEVFGAA